MSESVRIKIRKLLALAGNNPNEHEAKVALEKAHRLMEEYGVQEVGDDPEHIEIKKGDWFVTGLKANWHKSLGAHVCRLYGCKYLYARDRSGDFVGAHSFVGMNHQIEAAEETFLFIVSQVESLYKTALKAFDGSLDKSQRAELRASFKDAVVVRVGVRISKILNDRQAQGTALVVLDRVAEEFDKMKERDGIRSTEIVARPGFGSGAGFNAGGMVRIQKEVE